jgi:ATP-dependent DNA helicase RecQ
LQCLQEAALAHKSVSMQKLADLSDTAVKKIKVIANYLESGGVIKKGRGLKAVRQFSSSEELAKFLEEYERRHQSDKDRLNQIMHYAQTMQCRVVFLQTYFGEEADKNCGRCDNCQPEV